MKARDYAKLSGVFLAAFHRARNGRDAHLIDDPVEFALRVVYAEDSERARLARAAIGSRREAAKARVVPVRPLRLAREFAPVIKAVADAHGLPVVELTGPSQEAPVLLARFEAMWRIRYLPRAVAPSWAVIAAALGRADHTTAINGVRKFEARLAADPELRARVLGERERRAA